MSRIAGCKDFRPHLPQQTNPETTHANLLLKKQKPKVSRKKHALYAGNPLPPPILQTALLKSAAKIHCRPSPCSPTGKMTSKKGNTPQTMQCNMQTHAITTITKQKQANISPTPPKLHLMQEKLHRT